jgi:hypothetical protein
MAGSGTSRPCASELNPLRDKMDLPTIKANRKAVDIQLPPQIATLGQFARARRHLRTRSGLSVCRVGKIAGEGGTSLSTTTGDFAHPTD